MQSLRSAIPFFPSFGTPSPSYLPLSTSSNRSSASSGHPLDPNTTGGPVTDRLLDASLLTSNHDDDDDQDGERNYEAEALYSSLARKNTATRRRVRSGLLLGGVAVIAFGTAYTGTRYALARSEADLSTWPSAPATTTTSGLPSDAEVGHNSVPSSGSDPASDVTYDKFRLSSLPPQPDHFPLLRPSRLLPTENDCLELWFSAGEVCQVKDVDQPLGPEEQIDIIQLWVNGSDPIWRTGLEEKSREVFGTVRDTARHYRDQGGLRYSMRSAAQNFAKGDEGQGSYVRKIHVLTADMPGSSDHGDIRLGQIPSWMDKDLLAPTSEPPSSAYTPALQIHHHAEVFRFAPSVFSSTAEPQIPWANQTSWQEEALPTFNSFAIETRVGWLSDLADTCIQANDDMFFHLPLSTADFWSPTYGSMFRLDNQYGLQVKPILEAGKIADPGEWGGLQHANWLLSKRFYERPRRYINHLPKTLTVPILHEAAILFPKDLALASARSFRESRAGQGDIELAFLITWLRIERYREALLWTWVVGKLGHADGGSWAETARAELKALLGLNELAGEVEVWQGKRESLNHYAESFSKAGWTGPKQTVPSFTSMDGHLPDLSPPREAPNFGEHCAINLEHCFTKEWLAGGEMSAADMFTRLTFDRWSCGDCLIKALVAKSGPRGLSAFLPPSTAEVKVVETTSDAYAGTPTAHLPLEREWQNNSFALHDVLNSRTVDTSASINLRLWCMQLLSRYMYQLGNSQAEFTPIKSVGSATSLVQKYRKRPDVAMSCINDDEPDRQADAVGEILRKWMEETWPRKPWWERS